MVMRCRTGIVARAEFGTVPDQRCSVSRRTASGKSLPLRRPKLHVDVLFLRVGEHLLETFLAADAGLLVAAERRAEEMLGDFVDPDEAGLHRGGGAVRGREV